MATLLAYLNGVHSRKAPFAYTTNQRKVILLSRRMLVYHIAGTYMLLTFVPAVGAEVRCIEEQSNSVVVGSTPTHIFSAEAPHVCVSACIKAKPPTCSLSAFTRRSDRENGTCFLYKESAEKIAVKRRSLKVSKSSGAINSVYKLLQRCPNVDKNISEVAKKYIKMGGRKVLNIEGKAGWGMPVEVHVDDWGPWSEWSPCVEPIPVAEEIAVHNRVRMCAACGVNRVIEFETTSCDCCPEWLPWGPWGPCSASCGTGVSIRSRLCTIPGACPGPSEDVRPCAMAPCATWTVWGPWGPCVGACGIGHRERIRHCEGVGSCPGPASESMVCHEVPPCCSQWSPLSPCSVTCGRGIQTRFRRCEPVGHPMIPHLEESIPCDMGPCGHWVPCMTWVEETGPVIDEECMARKNVGCVKEEPNSVIDGEVPDETMEVEAAHMCIATCMLARAMPCSVALFTRKSLYENGTCNLYKKEADKMRIRQIRQGPSGSMSSVFKYSRDCPPINKTLVDAQKTRKISKVEGRAGYGAPVQIYSNGWGPWSAWSSCVSTVSCGRTWTVQNRIRICSVCGQSRAIEVESRPCDCCQAEWLAWGAWSPCSATCGEGTSARYRQCQTPGACTGEAQESRTCNAGPCAQWGPWNDWSACPVTCGTGGQRERMRQCFGGGQCVGAAREYTPCDNLPPCCTQWSAWGACSVTCGEGTQTRTRECGSDPSGSYNAELVETRPCSNRPCAYWLPWTEWTPCSSSCGPGTSFRQRECQGGVAEVDCPGSAQESRQCDGGPCPMWSAWNAWTPCSVTCGTGERTRQRQCMHGTDCPGESFQSKPCYLCDCPSWTQWNPWEDCDPSTGQQTRIRYCCGSPDGSSSACPGEAQESQPCTPQLESGTGVQSPSPYDMRKSALQFTWTEWSACSVTCGQGIQTRNGMCQGTTRCTPKREERKCETAPCGGYADKRFHQFYASRRRDRVSKGGTGN
ncbi:hypothetical protein M513_01069 [Trichuris suis]|uniref:Thrombospondin type 1 domain protein n=1 Tax=Trichuris suis TaxID=68888 RepID=A0A085MKU0_9BILA|nr:hypothetical protein M513_01069 [Trichuris suis]